MTGRSGQHLTQLSRRQTRGLRYRSSALHKPIGLGYHSSRSDELRNNLSRNNPQRRSILSSQGTILPKRRPTLSNLGTIPSNLGIILYNRGTIFPNPVT